MRLTTLAVLAGVLAGAASAGVPLRPDPTLTPGVVDPAKTVTVICVRGYTAEPGVRHVTEATKAERFRAYGVDPKAGGPYEIDHLVSLELGGANDPKNLWPQSYTTQPWNAHRKDELENRLHALVCAGTVPLDQAQREIEADWIAAYQKYVRLSP